MKVIDTTDLWDVRRELDRLVQFRDRWSRRDGRRYGYLAARERHLLCSLPRE